MGSRSVSRTLVARVSVAAFAAQLALGTFSFGVMPMVASAASTTLYATVEGSSTAWTLGAGASKVIAVGSGDATDTTYIDSPGGNAERQSFTFSTAGIAAGSTINSVTIHTVAKKSGGGSPDIKMAVETTNVGSDISLTGSYVDYSTSALTTNPATGLAWTLATLGSANVGVVTTNASGTARVSQIYLVVDYTEAPVSSASSSATTSSSSEASSASSESFSSSNVSFSSSSESSFLSVSSASSSSDSSSTASSVSSNVAFDTDEDGVPDGLVCSTTFLPVCTPVPDLCTPGPLVCTPGPLVCIEEVCIPGPPICVPGAPMCIPQPDSCITVPVTYCSGPDNCPLTFNPDQSDENENFVGDACESSSSSAASQESSESDDDPTNGSYRGSRTNVLRSIIAMFGGQPTGVPPPAFGGPREEEFTNAEVALICTLRNALPDDAVDAVYVWVAEELATKMPHSVEAILDELETGSICPQVVAKVERTPKPVAFHVDVDGYPLSDNETWNKCIRGTATLQDIRNNPDRDEDGFGYSCSRYHTQALWRHPDLSMYFTFKGAKLSLPAGYALKQAVSVTQK